jgi:hypothetical protein
LAGSPRHRQHGDAAASSADRGRCRSGFPDDDRTENKIPFGIKVCCSQERSGSGTDAHWEGETAFNLEIPDGG